MKQCLAEYKQTSVQFCGQPVSPIRKVGEQQGWMCLNLSIEQGYTVRNGQDLLMGVRARLG